MFHFSNALNPCCDILVTYIKHIDLHLQLHVNRSKFVYIVLSVALYMFQNGFEQIIIQKKS